MRKLLLSIGLIFVLPVAADARCGGKPQMKLQDGTRGCVGSRELIDFTSSWGIEGSGPASTRTNVHKVPFVRFESIATERKSVSKRQIRNWAQQICETYKSEFEAMGNFRRDPFMVVLFSWGRGNPIRTVTLKGKEVQFLKDNAVVEHAHMRRNCRVRRQS